MGQAANSPVFGQSALGFEIVCKKFFGGDVIPGRCGLPAN